MFNGVIRKYNKNIKYFFISDGTWMKLECEIYI